MARRQPALRFAPRSDDGIEVAILGGDVVVRRDGWLARALRDWCRTWLEEVLLVAERRLPTLSGQGTRPPPGHN